MMKKNKEKTIRKYIESENFSRSDLIKVLHRVQQDYGYVPDFFQSEIALKLDVPLSEVNGVVTFYSYFTTEPRGKYSINICMGTACYVKGAQKIFDKFCEELGVAVGETTADGIFTLEGCRCIGACGLAPVITINEDVHGQLQVTDVSGLIDYYRKKEGE